jgi:hypothetical protein
MRTDLGSGRGVENDDRPASLGRRARHAHRWRAQTDYLARNAEMAPTSQTMMSLSFLPLLTSPSGPARATRIAVLWETYQRFMVARILG